MARVGLKFPRQDGDARKQDSTLHYPPEFKREAAQIYQVSRESISKMTEELEMATESLRRWIQQHEIDEGEREGLTIDEREELA